MRSASISCAWNMSVRRQSNASVATERITSFLPTLTPKSVSRPQIATTTAPGTPNCASILRSVAACVCMRRRPLVMRSREIMRPENSSKVCLNTPWRLSAASTDWSSVRPSSALRPFRETPLRGGVLLELGDEGVEAARRIAGGAERRRAEHGRQQSGGGERFNESHFLPRIVRNFVATRCNGTAGDRVARSNGEVKARG